MAIVDVLGSVTAQTRDVLDIQARLTAELAEPVQDSNDLPTMRRNYRADHVFWNEGGPTMVRSVDARVTTPYGDVLTRAHHPVEGTDGSALGCIVYIHGGGFVLGDLDTHDRIMRVLAEATGAVVVGVDYTLSPEAKFPQAVHESAAVVRHVRAHAEEIGIDPASVALAGDSGGAMLALATALYLRDTRGDDEPGLTSLLLWYGMYGLQDSGSRRLLGGPWDGLTKDDLDYYVAAYTTGPQDWSSPYVDCLGADLSHGIPPCYVVATELDPLLDDSVTLARMLEEHGVAHQLRVYPGLLHAFLHCSRVLPEARDTLAEGAAFYRVHQDGAAAGPGSTTPTTTTPG